MSNITKEDLQKKESEILNILNDHPEEVKKNQTGRMSFDFSIEGCLVFTYAVEQGFMGEVEFYYTINEENINLLIKFLKSKNFTN